MKNIYYLIFIWILLTSSGVLLKLNGFNVQIANIILLLSTISFFILIFTFFKKISER